MVESINSVNDQKYEKPGLIANMGGIVASIGTMAGAGYLGNRISKQIAGQLHANKANLDDIVIINNYISNFQQVNPLGLASKGVSIKRYSIQNAAEIENILKREESFLIKKLPKNIKEYFNNAFNEIKLGINALYCRATKTIVLPEKGMTFSVFHELGHAANANLNKISNILQGSRKSTIFILPMFLIALLKTKKAPEEKSTNLIGKTTDFIKNNYGKLSLIMILPAIIEEHLASLRGEKIAEKVISSDTLKKVIKNNRLCLLSYIALAGTFIAGTFSAIKIKDFIAKPKPVKDE